MRSKTFKWQITAFAIYVAGVFALMFLCGALVYLITGSIPFMKEYGVPAGFYAANFAFGLYLLWPRIIFPMLITTMYSWLLPKLPVVLEKTVYTLLIIPISIKYVILTILYLQISFVFWQVIQVIHEQLSRRKAPTN